MFLIEMFRIKNNVLYTDTMGVCVNASWHFRRHSVIQNCAIFYLNFYLMIAPSHSLSYVYPYGRAPPRLGHMVLGNI